MDVGGKFSSAPNLILIRSINLEYDLSLLNFFVPLSFKILYNFILHEKQTHGSSRRKRVIFFKK